MASLVDAHTDLYNASCYLRVIVCGFMDRRRIHLVGRAHKLVHMHENSKTSSELVGIP